MSSALSRIADSTRFISTPGRSAFRWPRIPSRVYWIDNHRSRHDSLHQLYGRRVGSAGGTIQGSIRQTQTLCDHRLLRLRSGQLRDRIHLIQTQLTSSEPGTQQRQILQPPRHPNQLSRSRMAKTKPGRHPLRKIPRPIRQKPLTHISVDQPFTDPGVENGQPREQVTQHLVHLIVRETLPFHSPTVRTGCDRNRSETGHPQGKLRNFYRPNGPSIPGPASRGRRAIPRRHPLCRGRRTELHPPRRGHRRARSGSWR